MVSSATTEMATRARPSKDTATARRTVDVGIRRPKVSMSRSPRASAMTARTSTANVVTFTPPAVDAEPPPIIMRMSCTKCVCERIEPTLSAEIPEDRELTPASIALRIFEGVSTDPSVAGLCHSVSARARAPMNARIR